MCPFILPNGEKCGKAHLQQFCFYEKPERCRDPKVRSLVEKRLADMQASSGSGNFTDAEPLEFYCITIGEEAEPGEVVPEGSVDPPEERNARPRRLAVRGLIPPLVRPSDKGKETIPVLSPLHRRMARSGSASRQLLQRLPSILKRPLLL